MLRSTLGETRSVEAFRGRHEPYRADGSEPFEGPDALRPVVVVACAVACVLALLLALCLHALLLGGSFQELAEGESAELSVPEELGKVYVDPETGKSYVARADGAIEEIEMDW